MVIKAVVLGDAVGGVHDGINAVKHAHLFDEGLCRVDDVKDRFYDDRPFTMNTRLVFAWLLLAPLAALHAGSADEELALALQATEWKSGLRLDLQRPIDPRLAKIEAGDIAHCDLFRGKVHLVRSAAEVSGLSGKLAPGDQLVLAGDDWKDARFTLEGHGTAEAPILIRPEKPGGIVFTGESSVRFHGEHLIVHDLAFREVTSSQDNAVIFVVGNGEAKPADHCLFNRIRIDDCGSANPADRTKHKLWLISMRGSGNTVANGTFRGLKNIAC